MEKESEERNVDNEIQVQLEEDETATQDRAGWRQVVYSLCSTSSENACHMKLYLITFFSNHKAILPFEKRLHWYVEQIMTLPLLSM